MSGILRSVSVIVCICIATLGCQHKADMTGSENAKLGVANPTEDVSTGGSEEMYNHAVDLLCSHQLVEAKRIFDTLAINSPSDVRFLSNSAYTSLCLEQFEVLQEKVDTALSIDPKGLLAKVVQAGIWIREGTKAAEAKKLLAEVILQDANMASAWMLKGQMEFTTASQGTAEGLTTRVDQARESFSKAKQLQPNSFLAHLEHGRITLQLHHMKQAIAGINTDSPITPEQKVELEKALSDLNKAIELNPDYHDVFAIRAKIREAISQKEPSVCVPDWCEALRRNPAEKPFVKILTQCLFFPETFGDTSLPPQIEAAFRLLDADGKKMVAEVALEQMQTYEKPLAQMEQLIVSGEEIPKAYGSREQAAARLTLIKKTRDQAVALVSRACGDLLTTAEAASPPSIKEENQADLDTEKRLNASSDEQKVKEIYESFSSGPERQLLIEILEGGKSLSDPSELALAVQSIDAQLRKATSFVNRSGGTLISQQLLGEMAYFLVNVRISIVEHPQLSAIPLSDEILSLESIKATCIQSFEKSIAEAPNVVSTPYDRLARLAIINNPNANAVDVANLLLNSVKNDPSSAMSIGLLIQLIVDTNLINDTGNYQYVFKILRTVKGDALIAVKTARERVQDEIGDLKSLSERSAILGWVDEETQSRLMHLFDVDVLLQGAATR